MADEHGQQPPELHEHVPAEQVADLLEGLLPDAEAATVAARLEECAECIHLRTQLAGLPAALSAEPVPPMPAGVAVRLDAVLSEAAAQRAARERPAAESATTESATAESAAAESAAGAPGHRGAPHPSPVATLADRRRRFLTRAGTGLAAAAAVIVGVVVVADVLGQGGATTDSATSDSSGASEQSQDGGGAADLARAQPPRLRAESFRAGVTGLLSVAGADDDGRASAPGTEQFPRALPPACTADALRSAGISGSPGPRALLDGTPVTLVTSGPSGRSLVVAYSCASGQPVEQARTHVDLAR
jgi:hypothetical protein